MEIEKLYRDHVKKYDDGYRQMMGSDFVSGVTYQHIKYLINRIDGLTEDVRVAMETLEPFAKSGELFKRVGVTQDQLIYCPAAGEEYSISAKNLLDAKDVLDALKILHGGE